ncbi:MAG: hypothetical protein ACR2PT_17935 [Endozoicomonas sp.]
MKKILRALLLIFPAMVLGACDGGGSESAVTATEKTFTVSLNSIDVKRVSNGESVAMDTSEIVSPALTFTQ